MAGGSHDRVFLVDNDAHWVLALCLTGLVAVTWTFAGADRWQPAADDPQARPGGGPAPTPYEVAYPARRSPPGNQHRDRGVGRCRCGPVSRDGILTQVSGAAPPAGPLERAVHGSLSGAHRGRPAGAVRSEVAVGPALAELRRRLVGRGWYLPYARGRRTR